MRRIKDRNTQPELSVRKLVYRLGFRYRLHRSDLPGKPDLALFGLRKAIFVHGCFWHQHKKCQDGRPPKSRQEYWLKKFESNQFRDKRAVRALRRLGWKVLIIWECETQNADLLEEKLRLFLSH